MKLLPGSYLYRHGFSWGGGNHLVRISQLVFCINTKEVSYINSKFYSHRGAWLLLDHAREDISELHCSRLIDSESLEFGIDKILTKTERIFFAYVLHCDSKTFCAEMLTDVIIVLLISHVCCVVEHEVKRSKFSNNLSVYAGMFSFLDMTHVIIAFHNSHTYTHNTRPFNSQYSHVYLKSWYVAIFIYKKQGFHYFHALNHLVTTATMVGHIPDEHWIHSKKMYVTIIINFCFDMRYPKWVLYK